ncbi:MAG: ribosome maturation factor RimP [Clostridia bacterium]|nr:ribosome maturation factor RimP [Clostridia bacterium]
MKTSETVAALLRGTVEEMGFDLYDVEYQKEQGAWVLTLFIDKEGGVDIDDCEKVSRAVEPVLDEKDPIADSYFLSVSSIGLDRPLKLDKDFTRNLGKKVTVKLYAPVDKKKEFTGTLQGFDAEAFILLCNGEERRFARKDAAKIVPYIDFADL